MDKHSQNHILTVAKNLKEFFNNKEFLNACIVVSGRKIWCNRLLLASSSDYFKALFKFDSPSLTRETFVLDADCLTPKGVNHVINYINSLGMTPDTIPKEDYGDVYAATSFLQVIELHEIISEKMATTLTVDNALYRRLTRKATAILQNKFQSIDYWSQEFLTLPPSLIELIYLGDETNAPNESFMVRSILAWITYDLEHRLEFFKQNFTSLLRLRLVSASELRSIVIDPHFSNAFEAVRLLVHWYNLSHPVPLFACSAEFSLRSNVPLEGWMQTMDLDSKFTALNAGNHLSSIDSARAGTDFRIYSVCGVNITHGVGIFII
ncbi:unnamed protein product [Protopolystoma xenopodis]|uniref:BTB domain-containing protein n=1 Tax=Protopolystoma xenopodis TaxID=117903 RepID=A0A448X5G2_9PLAT|nr:unnamed protein product [Protopolystoma xenopodis]